MTAAPCFNAGSAARDGGSSLLAWFWPVLHVFLQKNTLRGLGWPENHKKPNLPAGDLWVRQLCRFSFVAGVSFSANLHRKGR